MYNIKALEEQWEKYNHKKRRPWYIVIVLFLILLGAIMFGLFKIPSNLKSSSGNIFSAIDINNTLSVKSKSIIVKKKSLDTLVDIPILDEQKEEIHRNNSDELIVKKRLEKERKKIHFDIIDASTITAYQDVEDRFYRSHNTDDSLFLAKSYYKKQNYEKAQFWALETNKIDKNIEESTFIFVKSKVKLGSKNEAISILKAYIKKTNSPKAQDVLNMIMDNGL
jgi:hypothetical protein